MAWLWPVCEKSMACSKHGLRVVWLESLPLGTVWPILNGLNDRLWHDIDMQWSSHCIMHVKHRITWV